MLSVGREQFRFIFIIANELEFWLFRLFIVIESSNVERELIELYVM
jgi:hypothetical protein